MKVISAIIGLILVATSFTLSSLASSNANEMIAKKDAIVMKYIEQSDEAMENEDIKGAIKFIKLAIQADPKSRKAFKTYESIMETKYKPAQSDDGDEDNSEESPESEEEEEDTPDMGC